MPPGPMSIRGREVTRSPARSRRTRPDSRPTTGPSRPGAAAALHRSRAKSESSPSSRAKPASKSVPEADVERERQPTGQARPATRQKARKPALPPSGTVAAGADPTLEPSLPKAQAFRLAMRRCLDSIATLRNTTIAGDLDALHQMRIAMTRLRGTVSFFAPMTTDAEWRRLKHELKWINRRLGAARDLDVLVQKQGEKDAPRLTVDEQIALDRRWLASHARLARALQSSRYRRLLQRTSDWIERGPWSSSVGSRQDRLRQEALGAWCGRVLSRWHDRLVKRSRGLDQMDEETLHQLRLKTKRLRYAMEDYGPYVPDRPLHWSQAIAKQLRRAQGALGEINDAAQAPIRNGLRLKAKARKRLLREAEAAYRELGQLA
ncbi:hypothetical protein DB459_25740 [Bradyrhizobium sp. WD16]|nr:hypothetical protein DB459_25740 [Bradyrhizobium sp. WD16]